jgi:molybdopterin molybdotransferase
MKDVCSVTAKRLLSVDAALMQIKNSLVPVNGSEKITLKMALGRVLTKPVYSAINLPTERNAAMDGYAFASCDMKTNQPFHLTQVGTSWAGRPFTGELHPGECVRIFTGAVVPKQANSVIMQEQVTVNENNILFSANCKPLQNVRQVGEDVKKDSLLLGAGKKLSAVDLGLLTAVGVAEVEVVRPVKIAFFSTGDELAFVGTTLAFGQIYDSNRYLLHGLLTDTCFSVMDMGVIADDKELLKQALISAAAQMDVIITSGGASVGDADYIKEVLEQCGQVSFWKIAIKPGKPLAFGHIDSCVFFGLPGNPGAVVATFEQIVKPALQQLTGASSITRLRFKAICDGYLKKSAGRQEYQCGILQQNADGSFTVTSAGRQGSHILSTLSRANCYIVLPSECDGVQEGDQVTVEPFDNFI